MIRIQNQHIAVCREEGTIETSLSNGWTVKQQFNWEVDRDGLHVFYTADQMDVIGAEAVDEYSDEQAAVLDRCMLDEYALEQAIRESSVYKDEVEDFYARLDKYAYYGVSERDFCYGR